MFDSISTEPASLTPTGSNNYPRLVACPDGRIWAFWQRFTNDDGDDVFGRRFDGRTWSEDVRVSEDRCAFRPRAAGVGGDVWVAWSSYSGDYWDVYARRMQTSLDASAGEIIRVSRSGQDHHCDVAVDPQKRPWLAWQSARSGKFAIHGTVLADSASEEFLVSDCGECYRPSVACGDDGRVWFVYEGFRGDRYDIYGKWLLDGVWSPEMRISTSDLTWSAEPIVRPDGCGVWVAWYEIGSKRYVSYRLRHYDGSNWGPEHEIAVFSEWYASIDILPDGKGGVWIALRKQLIHFDGTSFGPMGLFFGGTNYCRRSSLITDGKNLVVAWQRSPRGDHCSGFVDNREGEIWIRRVPLGECLEEQDRHIGTDVRPVLTSRFNQPGQPRQRVGEWNVYWGDIHGQIMFSDGLGGPDHFYNYEKVISHMEFGAVTDHSAFPDKLTDSEFEIIRHVTNLMNEPGRFPTIVAYEWSGNEWKARVGHKNIYFPGAGGRCYRICDPDSDTPDKLYARAREWGALVPAHHVDCNWNPGVVSADTDWSYHDPEVAPITEICSHHGICEYFGNPRAHGGQSNGRSVQDALARGYRLGFIASSDTHEMMPGQDGGIVAVLAKELTREAVFDAIKNRRCYASTAPRVLIDFRVNGTLMGSELRCAGERRITATVEAPCDILRLDIVKNNSNVHTVEVGRRSAQIEFADPVSEQATDYYYLRVTMEDHEFAWSSPVWVDS